MGGSYKGLSRKLERKRKGLSHTVPSLLTDNECHIKALAKGDGATEKIVWNDPM